MEWTLVTVKNENVELDKDFMSKIIHYSFSVVPVCKNQSVQSRVWLQNTFSFIQ